MHLEPIGEIRFARRSANFEETVRFYRELVGLPLFETFEASYGSNGAIFGLPRWNLTMEIVEATDGEVAFDNHEQLCLYFPESASPAGRDRASCSRRGTGSAAAPYWVATGAVTFRDPDGREVVFAPFVFGVNQPSDSVVSGKH